MASLTEGIAIEWGARNAQGSRKGSPSGVASRNKPQPVRLLPLCKRLGSVSPHTAILGLENDGTPLLLRIVAPEVSHVLITGISGAGKTALARTLLTSLAMYNRQSEVQLILIDPATRGFGPLACLPHVLGGVANTPAEALARLKWLAAEMARRDREGQSDPKLVVAIDELAELIQAGGRPVELLLTRLAQRGREVGIHMVACTREPKADLVGSGIAMNFPVRLVGTAANKGEARHATGMAESGAEKLAGKGDFLLVSRGAVVRFQSAWMGPKTLRMVNERLQRNERTSRGWADETEQQTALAVQSGQAPKGLLSLLTRWQNFLGANKSDK